MYSKIGSFACVTGEQGKYDKVCKDKSIRYGRNSVNNYMQYQKELLAAKDADINPENWQDLDKYYEFIRSLDKFDGTTTPLKFVQKYMPGNIKNGQIDKMALMGTAYEQMGKHSWVSTDFLGKFMQKSLGSNVTAKALDINKDGKVDLGEYSTSILAADSLSRSDVVAPKNIKGYIKNEGLTKSMGLAAKQNYDIASKIYSSLYDHYNLGQAQKDFIAKEKIK